MPRPTPLDDATSRRMRRQRRERTRPEETFAEFLTRRGYRVERNVADLPGRPDIVLPRRGVVIFVHGCFWHGCPRHGTIPKNNRAFWSGKIEANRARDRRKSARLRRLGWHVLTVWEHDEPESCLARVRRVAGRGR
jgi:DNA mismatch endonuclease (patch repair protein)